MQYSFRKSCFKKFITNRMKLKQFFAAILLLSVFTSSNVSAQETKVIDQVVGMVGNSMILMSEIEAQYLQMQAQGVSVTSNTKCEIFEEMLLQKLFLNQAIIDSIVVTDKDVTQQINHRISSMTEQLGGEKKIEEYFNKPISEIKNYFRDIIKDQLLTQKMQAKITEGQKVTPSEVKTFFKSMPKDSLPIVPTQFEIQQIEKKPPMTRDEKNKLRDRLNSIRERILKGENFGTLAVLYSEDPGSAANGGELGFATRSTFVPEFAAVAFSLKVGETSRIVETEFGFHVIQLVEKRGEQANFRHILLTPKMDAGSKLRAKHFLDSIHTLLKKDTVKFEQRAAFNSDDVDTRANGGLMVNPQTGNSKFEVKHLDPEMNYTIKGMKVGDISEPFEASDAKGRKVYRIVKLKSKVEQHTASLESDYQLILDMALANKKQKTLDAWIKEKQKTNYVRIDPLYKNCTFRYKGWEKL